MSQTAFVQHDHSACISRSVAALETYCAEKRLKLTPVRRRALEVLLQDHRALGAYDILEVLSAEGLGSQPPVAYRALNFLVEHGFAHRVDRLNAFVACLHADKAHAPAFLICRNCGSIDEVQDNALDDAITALANARGFVPARYGVEVEGLCPECGAAQ